MIAKQAAATLKQMPMAGPIGWMPGAVGAAIGILLIGLVSRWILGTATALPWLVAPMGASAVLVFVLPASPLSQPWPVIGGHMIAALCSVAVHSLVPDPAIGSALAVGLTIALTSIARCLHPPAGGTALLATLGNPAITALGWRLIGEPVALNALILLICGYGWHRLKGHSYPHRTAITAPSANRAGQIDEADIDAVLAEWDEVLDISREDLIAVLRAVEQQRQSRKTKP